MKKTGYSVNKFYAFSTQKPVFIWDMDDKTPLEKPPPLKSAAAQKAPPDIRIWGGLLAIPVIVVLIALAFPAKKKEEATDPSQAEQQLAASLAAGRGGLYEQPDVVDAEKAAQCDFSDWIGKELNMSAIRKLLRPYRAIPQGTPLKPVGDPDFITIELDENALVAKVWCG